MQSTSLGGSVPAAPRLIFCLPTPRLNHQASLDLQLQKAPIPPQLPSKKSQGLQNVLPPRQSRALNLPGHHIGHANPDEQVHRAANNLSSLETNQIANISTLYGNRFAQISQQSSTPCTMFSSRSFSSLLSTPTRFQPSRTLGARLSSPSATTASAFSPLSSLLSQKAPSQSRSFSASASLGVRRVTFRPSRRVQKRRHGYLARKKDRNGRKTLIRRTLKGRKELSW